MSALVESRVADLLARCRLDVDEGFLPSCQVAVAYEGEVVVSETFGDATPDTRYIVYSATKPFVAGMMWQLIGDGTVDPGKLVIDYVPEFGTNGKDVITVEQVMLHTSGFPMAPMWHPQWATSAGRREAFARWRLNWEPGTAFEYHPTAAHWVLAEIIGAVTGQDYRDRLEQYITGPLGLPRVLGLPADQQDGIATVASYNEPPSADELEATLGIRELPLSEVTDEALIMLNRPEVREVGVPGGGGIMLASHLALYYQALLHNTGGLWDPAVLADATGNVRNTFPDPMMGMSANRTLGLVQAGGDGKAQLRGMGRTVSARAFGHNGAAGQVAWGDPETGLSFGYCTNGIDAHIIRQWRRSSAVASRAGLCREPV